MVQRAESEAIDSVDDHSRSPSPDITREGSNRSASSESGDDDPDIHVNNIPRSQVRLAMFSLVCQAHDPALPHRRSFQANVESRGVPIPTVTGIARGPRRHQTTKRLTIYPAPRRSVSRDFCHDFTCLIALLAGYRLLQEGHPSKTPARASQDIGFGGV